MVGVIYCMKNYVIDKKSMTKSTAMTIINKLIQDLKEHPFKTVTGILAGVGVYYLINFVYTQMTAS
jgi:hypothetical protein